jgi:hypothetical protein
MLKIEPHRDADAGLTPVAMFVAQEILALVHEADGTTTLHLQSGRTLSAKGHILPSDLKYAQDYALPVNDVVEARLAVQNDPAKFERLVSEKSRGMRPVTSATRQVCPRYFITPHQSCAYRDDQTTDDNLARVLRERNGVPPANWTHELILIPNSRTVAVLLCAIPSPDFGDFYVPYKEFRFAAQCSPSEIAKAVREQSGGVLFERFIGDAHALRMAPMSMGVSLGETYSNAFSHAALVTRQFGCNFVPGSDNIERRRLDLQSWSRAAVGKWTQLRVVFDTCPMLWGALIAKEDKLTLQDRDLLMALELWASSSPVYVEQS